jgi:hypothetical protein
VSYRSRELPAEAVALLARLLDVPVAADEAEALAAAARTQLAAVAALDRLPLHDVQPALGFDPRWDD